MAETSGEQVNSAALYLAVLPGYRRECFEILSVELPELRIYVSPAHLDPTVRTGIPASQYSPVKMRRFLGKVFLQTGRWRSALNARTLVVDMNPRSLTAWVFLLARKTGKRRTLVWGHLHPQAGRGSRTRFLRSAMRRLADGTITYTYENAEAAKRELPGQPVWVAPNSIYRRESIRYSETHRSERRDIAYVGRFEPAKKVGLLVEGFSRSGLAAEGARLVLVGGGSESVKLTEQVRDLDLTDSVVFAGWISDVNALREIYDGCFVSASPGFIGLGLTQSLGFGVPMVAARNEPHSPEVELAATGGVTWFESDSADALAQALRTAWKSKSSVPSAKLQRIVATRYAAEEMASGLANAIRDIESSSAAALANEVPT